MMEEDNDDDDLDHTNTDTNNRTSDIDNNYVNEDELFLRTYDSDGYGDEEDRERLNEMNELDREEELAKRASRMKILKDRKRILEKAKMKERQQQQQQQQEGEDDDNDNNKKTNDNKSGNKSRSRQRQGEDAKSKKALEDIQKKTTLAKKETKKKRKKKSALDGDDSDDDDSDDDDSDDDSNDDDSEDDDDSDSDNKLDSEDEDEFAMTKKRRKSTLINARRGNKQQKRGGRKQRKRSSESSSDDFDDFDDVDVFEEATAKEVRAITLPRSKLEKWISEPFYETAVEGAFVRVNIGLDKNKESQYRLCQISGIADGSYQGTTQTYNLKAYDYNVYAEGGGSSKSGAPQQKKTTKKWLILRWGNHEKTFRISETSNRVDDAFAREDDQAYILDEADARFKSSEFGKWYEHVKKTSKKHLPSVEECETISQKLKGADEYRYTAEDVQKMLELNKKKRGGLSTNFIFEKEQLKMQLAKALEEEDIEAQERLKSSIADVNEKIEEKLNSRGGNQKVMADINKKNEFSNAIKLSQAAVKHIKKVKEGKDISEDDPFSRRPTRVTTYWSMKTDKKDAVGDQKNAKKKSSSVEDAAARKKNEKVEFEEELDVADYKSMKEKLRETLLHISNSHKIAQDKMDFDALKPSFTHAKRATERDPVLVKQRFAAGRLMNTLLTAVAAPGDDGDYRSLEKSQIAGVNTLSVKEYHARQEARS